uniref:Uncharacterized protein n=1 Tax=Panagrolaimus sp. ES5 TaxID=591445 RepID=A0AC34FDH1_9BILA
MSPVGSYNLQKYQQYIDQPSTSSTDNIDTTISTSTSTRMLPYSSGAGSFKQASPGASKMTYNELQVTNPLNYATSPLSDSLLLALRRSRPNTR